MSTAERFAIDAQAEATEAQAKLAQRDFQTAFENGDVPAMAASQRVLARAEAKAIRLDVARAELEQRYSRPTPTDPVEAYIGDRSEASANWLRSHREFVTESHRNAKLQSAHHLAIAEGHAADSPGYFKFVEERLGFRTAPEPKTVRLSRREVETAESLGLSLTEYIRRRRITDTAPEFNWRQPD